MERLEAQQRYQLASTLYKSGKYSEALALLEEVAQVFPNHAEVAYSRALCLRKLGRLKEVQKICDHLDIVLNDPRGAQLRGELGLEASEKTAPAGHRALGGRWRLALGGAVAAVFILAGMGTALNYLQAEEPIKQAAEPAPPTPQSRLRVLTLDGNLLDDEDMAHLANLSALERLDLQNTEVSDAGLSYLYDLRNLRELQLSGTLVTSSGSRQLQQALPDVNIVQ